MGTCLGKWGIGCKFTIIGANEDLFYLIIGRGKSLR